MSSPAHQLGVYLHLARASGQRRRPHVRDRLLALAGATAMEALLPRIATVCREEILRHNPRHIIHRWPTFAEAFVDEDFQHFLRHLWRRYPLETAEQMLSTLGIEMAQEREAYFSDEEYAAALLNVRLEDLA